MVEEMIFGGETVVKHLFFFDLSPLITLSKMEHHAIKFKILNTWFIKQCEEKRTLLKYTTSVRSNGNIHLRFCRTWCENECFKMTNL